jgi:hypothetical protein
MVSQLPPRLKPGISVDDARDVLLRLEGVVPGKSYGYPAFLLGGKFFARFRDDDAVLVLQLGSIEDRDVLMQLDPQAFFFSDHYRNSPAVLIRLAEVSQALLTDVAAQAWKEVAARRKVGVAAGVPKKRTAGRANARRRPPTT